MTDLDVPAQVERLRELFAPDPTDPPAGWDAVRAFEAQHGVTLPEPFRTFTATVTSGGAECGPDGYALTTLSGEPPGVLSAPFPLTGTWTSAVDDPDDPDDPAAVAVASQGVLPLTTDLPNWFLVVTGAHRGQVWLIGDRSAQPFGREFGYTTGASGFLGWVEHWHGRTMEVGDVDLWWDGVVPEVPRALTASERSAAIRRAGAAHRARKQAVASIVTGAATLSEVLDRARDDRIIGKMHLRDLLCRLPDMRMVDVDEVLRQAGIPAVQRLHFLRDPARRALLDLLDRRRPAPGAEGPT